MLKKNVRIKNIKDDNLMDDLKYWLKKLQMKEFLLLNS